MWIGRLSEHSNEILISVRFGAVQKGPLNFQKLKSEDPTSGILHTELFLSKSYLGLSACLVWLFSQCQENRHFQGQLIWSSDKYLLSAKANCYFFFHSEDFLKLIFKSFRCILYAYFNLCQKYNIFWPEHTLKKTKILIMEEKHA